MRARVLRTTASPEVVAAGVELTRDVLVPTARAQPGYRGYIAIYDAERGEGLAVTLWEDDETERASDQAARVGREQLAAAFGATVTVEKYDVAIADFVPE